MTWLSEHWLELLPSAISLVVLGLSIRWHCRNDDRKFGEVMGRLKALERKE